MTDHDISLTLRTLDFAAMKHRAHRRKDAEGTAYINHLITVTRTLWDVGQVRDSTLIVAALLHDTSRTPKPRRTSSRPSSARASAAWWPS